MQTKHKPVLSGHSIKVKNRDARKSQLTCALLCFLYYLLVLQARTTAEALGSNYSKQLLHICPRNFLFIHLAFQCALQGLWIPDTDFIDSYLHLSACISQAFIYRKIIVKIKGIWLSIIKPHLHEALHLLIMMIKEN